MADAPYLVALALVDSAGQRSLPLTGKTAPATVVEAADPGETGRTLALELLLRLWQRSDAAPLQRAAGDQSLLLVELPMVALMDQLPVLKANWVAGGETAVFLEGLAELTLRAWRIQFSKQEPLAFLAWP